MLKTTVLWASSNEFLFACKSSLAVLHLSLSLVMCHQDSKCPLPRVFRQDLSNGTKMPQPGQSHNVVGSPYVKHNSRSEGSVFAPPLPDLILYTRHSCTLLAAACVISLTTKKKSNSAIQVIACGGGGVHTFPKSINPKMNTVQLEFELFYYDVTVQHISDYATQLQTQSRPWSNSNKVFLPIP